MHPSRELLGTESPRVLSTNPDNPYAGRLFVWAKTRWYERIQGETGAVAFAPIDGTEERIRSIARQEDAELDELDDDFAEEVRQDFMAQEPLYPEAPELSDQPSFVEEGEEPS